MLKSNLRNQVRQTTLPKWKPWIPLFEAVMNAFQAIREANKPDGAGRILVEIERENTLVAKEDAPIHAIRITDDGCGMPTRRLQLRPAGIAILPSWTWKPS